MSPADDERREQLIRSITQQGGRGFGLCAACQRFGSCHLGIEEVRPHGEGGLIAVVQCPPEFEGAPGVAHGGWIAAVFDDLLGQLSVIYGQLHVTAELTVEFKKPVPVGRTVHLVGQRGEQDGRRLAMTAEMTLASSGAQLATAHGTWVQRDFSHYEAHDQWLAEQDGDDQRDRS